MTALAKLATELPEIATLQKTSISLATLEAILCPEVESRYYFYDPAWSGSEQLASMRNGSGDEYSIIFNASGAYIRGFDHESPISPYANGLLGVWPGLVDDVPEEFSGYVTEPAFGSETLPLITVCLWRFHDGHQPWRHGVVNFPDDDPDQGGATWLFGLLSERSPSAYQRFASECHETVPDERSIQAILNLEPLTQDLTSSLNSAMSWPEIANTAEGLSYPVAGATR